MEKEVIGVKKCLSQEGLKGIACVSMLLDHIGALLLDWHWLRVVGRLAFPIYCFLLVEGMHHSKDLNKYHKRLVIGMLLAELPFDLAFAGRMNWESCSVMVTLWLGFWAVWVMQNWDGFRKWAAVIGIALLSELLRSDYASTGIGMIVLFELTREQMPVLLLCGMTLLNWMGSDVNVFGIGIPQQLFAVAALLPIGCYNGEKRTYSKGLQWCFYLFYPLHLLILWGCTL